MKLIYILAAVLIFGILIALHELGHFMAAKLCGVQVNEFSIGMGPCVWQRQYGETQYSLRALPVGGFCAMEGEEEASENPRALNQQGFWKKLLIFAAGAAMNFLTGLVILLVLYSGTKSILVPSIAGTAPEFSTVNSGAVLEEGDVFWSINGERVYLFGDVSLLMSLKSGESLDLVVLRDGQKVEFPGLQWSTFTSTDGTTQYDGYGIYRSQNTTVPATLGKKLETSWMNTLDFVRLVRLSLQMLSSGQAGMDDVSGPVGIVSEITEVGENAKNIRDAVDNILYMAALIAVNLAVMNLLPIPALDGGHILFLVLDAIAFAVLKKRIPERYKNAISSAFFALLMAFMLLITFHDVFKLFQ